MRTANFLVGVNIEFIRKDVLGLNQDTFAERIATELDKLFPEEGDHKKPSRLTIGKWERCDTAPDLKTLYAISAMTNGSYDIGFLLGLYKNPSFEHMAIQNITGLAADTIFKLEEYNAAAHNERRKDLAEASKKMIQIADSLFASDELYRAILGICFSQELDKSESSDLLLESYKFKIQMELYSVIEKTFTDIIRG